jgi:phosphothreonine lyase
MAPPFPEAFAVIAADGGAGAAHGHERAAIFRPRNRPARLSLGSIQPVVLPAEQLNAQFEQLQTQMNALPRSKFRSADDTPDYKQMQSAFSRQYHGFTVTNFPAGMEGHGFIHATAGRNGESDGDKFHISVAADQLERGFAALASLLFSPDSPIRMWKISDLSVKRPDTPEGTRVTHGAQLTLYARTGIDRHYSADQLKKFKDFMIEMEHTLAEQGIAKGVRPESDVAPDHWNYLSYRNEKRSDRQGSEEQTRALQREPFFRLVSGFAQ